MANRKKEVYKPKPMTEGKRNLIQGCFRSTISNLLRIVPAQQSVYLNLFCHSAFYNKTFLIVTAICVY